MKKLVKILVLTVVALGAARLRAEEPELGETPSAGVWYGGISLLPFRYLQFPSPDYDLRILRVNLFSGACRSMAGLDYGLFCNYVETDAYGIQVSLCNWTEQTFGGIQLGVLNMCYGLCGLQLGVINYAIEGGGVQIGLANFTQSARGVQIGLINMIQDSPVGMLPIMNVNF